MATAIEINNITKRFSRSTGYANLLPGFIKKKQWIEAVRGVSLQINEGELFGLMGANGAGKTTLMKILGTLIIPTSGQATCCGYDVVKDEQQVKKIIGFISADERSFYWRLTGWQNLEFYARLYQVPEDQVRQRIRELLALVGLTEHADRRFHSYSTGMRQRMAIARGLLSDPRILLIDEPTKGLDPLSAESTRQFIRDLVARSGKTAILATHHVAEAEQLCDRIAIMDHGQIMAMGSLAELKNIAGEPEQCQIEIKNMEASIMDRLQLIPGIAFSQPYRNDGVTSLKILLSDRQLALPQVIRTIVENGGEVCNCQIRDTNLAQILASVLNKSK